MLKLWLPILFVFLIIGKCNQTTMKADIKSENRVYLNDKQLTLEEKTFENLNNSLFQLIETCDDFYEQLVSNNYVDQIKTTEKYLEIVYSNSLELNVGGRETIVVDRIFIPLTGKYQSNNEVSFFLGKGSYSIHPFVNRNGFNKLNGIIKEL